MQGMQFPNMTKRSANFEKRFVFFSFGYDRIHSQRYQFAEPYGKPEPCTILYFYAILPRCLLKENLQSEIRCRDFKV